MIYYQTKVILMKCYNYFQYMHAKKLINKKRYFEAYNIFRSLYSDEQNSNIIKQELLMLSEEIKQENILNVKKLMNIQNDKTKVKKYNFN